MTLLEVVRYVQQLKGLRRWVLPLPDWAARLQANVLEFVPGKPFSRDNYASLKQDAVCSGERCPTTVAAVVPHYLGQHHRQQRLQALRREAGRNVPPAPAA